MAKYRFVVNGDFVEVYDDAMLSLRVRSSTQDVDWFYDTTSSMMFEINGHPFFPHSPSEIEIDGVVLSAFTEFDAAIMSIFPNLAGGEGVAETPTLSDVLGEGSSAGELRITDLDDPSSSQDAATKAYVDNGTTTLTNKRITARYGSTSSSATPTINTDNVDVYELTAQAADITSFTTNLSGTPTIDQMLHIIITGTASRTITWGDSFEESTITLPTTTIDTDRLDVYFVWNATTSKWRVAGSW